MSKPFVNIKYLLMLMILTSSAFGYSTEYANAERETPLRWKNKKIPIAISTSLINQSINIKDKSDLLLALQNSFRKWEQAAEIEFDFSFTDKNSVSAKDGSGDGISLVTIAPTSENLLLFDEKISDISAKTRLFFTSKGEIKEADIVLNPILLFTTDGTFGTFDLEATLTHEIGHLLGLGHSQIGGSTMHSHQGKNGVYNLTGFNQRSLSQDDKARAISLYGKRKEDEKCCGEINGRISVINSDTKSFIWAEETESGRVITGVSTDRKGNFVLAGLPYASYRIYTRDENKNSSTILLDKVDLTEVKIKTLFEKVEYKSKDLQIKYIGYNGQLSSLSVPIQSGETHVIYVGGKNLNSDDFEIGFNSDNFKVNRDSVVWHNYANNLTVISFEVEISENTPDGEYSFFLKQSDGKNEYIVGGVTLESNRYTEFNGLSYSY
jgi:hypothetical protein